MDEYWDREEYWEGDNRCAVCRTTQLPLDDYVCSATCADVLSIREGSRVG